MIVRTTRLLIDDFDRAQTLTATPGMNGWNSKLTKTAGTPTSATITGSGGVMQLATDATSEAQICTMYQNDILFLPAGAKQLQHVWWVLKVSGIDAVTTFVAGLATAENDAIGSVTNYIWAKVLGSTSTSNIVLDSKDGTNTNANLATGKTLAATYVKIAFDFTNGLTDVHVYIDGSRISTAAAINMSGLSSTQCLQPYVQIGKASGTGVPAVQIAQYGHQYNKALGA